MGKNKTEKPRVRCFECANYKYSIINMAQRCEFYPNAIAGCDTFVLATKAVRIKMPT